MKKKICFVISSMCRGGAERVMSILVNNTVNNDCDVDLVLFSDPRVEYEIDKRVNIIKLPDMQGKVGRINRLFMRYKLLKRTLIDSKSDLVVSFLTMCNMYSAMALKGTNIPVVVSERNDPVKDCPNWLKRRLRDYCYRYADGVVFQTQSAKEYFNKKIQNRSMVIPNPVKNDLPCADVANAKKKVVAAARLMTQKNYPMMLKSFGLFLSDHPEYTLYIYGDGNLKESLVELSNDLGIGESVKFEGNVIDLHERIKDAKMFVLTSDYEGISNSLLEAMAMGLPCVSTDCPCGGSRMLIEDGVSGLLTPVGDEVAFYRAMKKIADEDSLALTLSRNAALTKALYSEDVIVKKYQDYFELVMAKHSIHFSKQEKNN